MDSRFKIQGSEKTSSIQPLWIQDSRFKAEGLRIQEVFFGSWKLNPTPLDSRSFLGSWILNLESYPLGFKKFFGILNLESWILPPLDSRSFLGSWILNLESYPLGFKKFFWILNLEPWTLPPWIQEVSLGSWILNPMYLGKGGTGTNLQKM